MLLHHQPTVLGEMRVGEASEGAAQWCKKEKEEVVGGKEGKGEKQRNIKKMCKIAKARDKSYKFKRYQTY